MQIQQSLARLAKPLRRKGRSHKGFNPAGSPDVRLFAAILRGEHAIMGFRNADIRVPLFGELRRRPTSSPPQRSGVTDSQAVSCPRSDRRDSLISPMAG